MNMKTVGYILLIIGIIVVVGSVLADSIGIGVTTTQFGWRQIVGLVVGIVIAAVGAYLGFIRKETSA